MTQESDESLRAFLDRREKQLTEGIAARHSELAPMEAELAEVRRAKGALGITQVVQMAARLTAVTSVRAELSDSPLTLRSQEQAHHDRVVQIVTERHRQMAAAETGVMAVQEDADHFSGHGVVSPSPYYQYSTIKQLIKKALTEHFQSGATAFQLREFFRDAWARDIDRESLSPQLSRLRNDKIIDRNSNVWFLVKKNEAPPGDDPDSAPESPDVGK
jgi:hypothetical protein